MESCGFSEPAPLGEIFLKNLERGKPLGIDSTHGREKEYSTKPFGDYKARPSTTRTPQNYGV